MAKFHLKLLIKNQKIASRKSIVRCEATLHKTAMAERHNILKKIKSEREFIAYSFEDIKTTRELINVIHELRHHNISKAGSYKDCLDCKTLMAEMSIKLPEVEEEIEPVVDPNREEEAKPRFGNLIAVLEQETADEKAIVESKNFPSPNDLTRWALKDAVLAFYQGLNIPEEAVIVDTLYDDRLITQLAPDFDVIAKIWIDKLGELIKRSDKYGLDYDEIDKAESDLADGMRGSAFEKQLDRYREEFMQKLKR